MDATKDLLCGELKPAPDLLVTQASRYQAHDLLLTASNPRLLRRLGMSLVHVLPRLRRLLWTARP